MMKTDFLIVGAGISGLTIAERIATRLNARVLVLEKRNHLGGNCYDYVNSDGILVPKYGPHYFHTNNERVWKYVSQFTQWRPFELKVLSYVDGMYVPVPVNITTVNQLLKTTIRNKAQMEKWLTQNRKKMAHPRNSEEVSWSRVGSYLYEKLFKNYTYKQWDTWPKDLDPSIMARIPVRTNFDNRYFTDTHQAMPQHGYAQLFANMVTHPNITVQLNTDFFKVKKDITYKYLFFTGPIDQFFGQKLDKLQYRSLRFEHETLDREYFQAGAQINYPNEYDFTRISEPKYSTGQKAPITTIIREYPTWDGEPYYPVLNKQNLGIYQKYQVEAFKLEEKKTYLVGRLANYKYFNMDQAFENALALFDRFKKSFC
jgi:UDP-galactopyranose mutase